MKQFEVFKSEGGYRAAGDIVNGGPVMNKSKWYASKRAAVCASNNMKRRKND